MRKYNIIKLCGIQENMIKKVERNEEKKEIYFYVKTKRKEQTCPCCRTKTKKIKDYREQKIKHINIGDCKSYIILNKRRYICPNCKKTFYEEYNFIQKYQRLSNSKFELIEKDLKKLKNLKTIAMDNDVSPCTVVRLMHISFFLSNKSVIKLPERIGIDEFKGNCDGEKYQFHIYDLDNNETIDVFKSRRYDALEEYFSSIPKAERRNVKIVSMDLYAPFKRIIIDKFPKAEIVADCFHYTKLVTQSLDGLRIKIWQRAKGHEKTYFKSIKRILVKKAKNLNEEQSERLHYAFEFSPILKEAYNLTQKFLNIKDLQTAEEKEKAFRRWLDLADASTIEEFEKVTKTLRQWHKYISNSFKLNISNGAVEGKNNLIKVLKRISFGYRNLRNFKERILLCSL